MSISSEFMSVLRSEFPDNRLTRQKNVATFHPESADEAARFFRLANQYVQKSYITGFGNNVDPEGEPFVNMVTVRTDRLNSLLDVSRADLFVRVGAGYPLREINNVIAGEELFLPHASLPYVGSVGGAVAINLTADLHGHALPIKRYFIQAEIVTPEGEIITPGSVAFKSVAGYDIVKLFAASWGVLGLIVQATFRVMPLSAAGEFTDMKMAAVDRGSFLAGLDEANSDTDAVYCRKIKTRFDPVGVLPIV
jgi:FAD/FMN-containing dehydrogenase